MRPDFGLSKAWDVSPLPNSRPISIGKLNV
jgi:hypothetical protein